MKDKLLKIKTLVFDVDGVFTNGQVLAMSDGDILRQFDSKDCFGIRMASMNGLRPAIITGGSSESILKRCQMMGVATEDVFLHSRDKLADFQQYCQKYGYAPDEVLYCGDDLPDIPVMLNCFGVAPADAVEEVKQAAAYVSAFGGGRGFIRNTVEMVMKVQGKWDFNVETYKKMF